MILRPLYPGKDEHGPESPQEAAFYEFSKHKRFRPELEKPCVISVDRCLIQSEDSLNIQMSDHPRQ